MSISNMLTDIQDAPVQFLDTIPPKGLHRKVLGGIIEASEVL